MIWDLPFFGVWTGKIRFGLLGIKDTKMRMGQPEYYYKDSCSQKSEIVSKTAIELATFDREFVLKISRKTESTVQHFCEV